MEDVFPLISSSTDEDVLPLMFSSNRGRHSSSTLFLCRGTGRGITYQKSDETIEIGKSKTVLDSETKEVVILSFGSLLDSAIHAGKELKAKVVDMRFIKPIDINLINEISNQFKLIVTLEDNVIAGGAGSAVNEELIALNSSSKVLNLGLPDGFIEHGDQEQQKIMNNLDGIGVRKAIKQKLKSI